MVKIQTVKYILLSLITIGLFSCKPNQGYLDGSFEIDGFKFDVNTPDFELNATTTPYINTTSVPIKINTSSSACSSVSKMALSLSATTPSDSAFILNCTSTPVLTTISVPSVQGLHTIYLHAKNDTGQFGQVLSIAINLDTLFPTGSVTTLSGTYRGGDTTALSMTSADDNSVSTQQLLISNDSGASFSPSMSLLPFDTSATYTFPNIDTTTAVVRFAVTDIAGNTTNYDTGVFAIDSTPPALPAVTLNSSTPTNLTAVTLTVADCTDRPFIFVNESTQPLRTDPSWQACSTAAGAITYSIAATEIVHALKVWAKDAVGNITATPVTVNVIYDVSNPTLSISNMSSPLSGTSSQAVTFTMTDLSGIASSILEYSTDGTTYTTIASNQTSPYSWTLPALNTSTARVRLSATDNAGNSASVQTTNFTIDSINPAAAITTPPSQLKGGQSYTISFSSSDANGVNNHAIYYAADGSTFSQIATPAVGATSLSWIVPYDDTSAAKLRIVATDNAGRSTTTDTAAFIIDSTAPSVTLTSPPSILKGGSTYNIAFTHSDTNTIASRTLEYAADGSTFSTVIASSPTSTHAWTVPTVDTLTSKIRYTVVDAAGNSTTMTSTAFIIDSTAPTMSITNLASNVAGASSQSVTFSVTDSNGIASKSLDYSTDGATWTNISASPTSPQSWTVPSVNSTTMRVRISAVDSAGNTNSATTSLFTIDSTPPGVAITTPPSDLKGGSTYSISFSSSDAIGVASHTLYYAADGITFSAITSPAVGATSYSWTVPSDNVATAKLRIIATDLSGNTNTATTSAFIVDSIAPVANLTNPPSILKGGSSHNIVFSHSDTNVIASRTLEYAADGSTFSTVIATSPTSAYAWTVPSSNTTASKIRYTVVDTAGNSTTTTSTAFIIDSTVPALSINNMAAYVAGGSSQSVTFTATDANGLASKSLDYSTDGATWTNISASPTSPQSWTIPSINSSTARVRISATDNAGNTNTATTALFTIDSILPAASITTPASALRGGQTYSMSFSSSDANGVASHSLYYAANGTTFSLITSPAVGATSYSWTVPASNTTTAKIRIVATDVAGNVRTTDSTAFTVDSTPPSAPAITLSSASLTNSTAITFTASSCADTPFVLVNESTQPAMGDSAWQACSTTASAITHTLSPATEASHSFKVWSKDSVGNVSSTATTIVVIYDITPPSLTLPNLPLTIRGGNTQSVSFSSSDLNGVASYTVQYAADGTTFSTTLLSNPTTSPYTWTIPTVNTTGSKLKITSTDNAGNTTSLTTSGFNIDSTAPTPPTITRFSASPTNSTSITMTSSSCTDTPLLLVNESTQPARTDLAWQACSTTAGAITFTIPATEGVHTLKIWAQDAVGNVSSTFSTITVTYDITPPVLTVTSPANNSYAKNSVIMTGACETGVTINFSGDIPAAFGVACSGGTYSQTVNLTTGDGPKNISVAETDAAGNTTTVNRTYINDNLPPIITRTSPISPILTNTNTVAWTGTCEGNYTINVTGDYTGSFACVSGTWNWTTPTKTLDGTYNFSLVQTDAAGNTSTALPLQWTRDNTAPVFTVNQSTNLTNNKSSQIYDGSCEGTNPIIITGATSDAISCSANSWTWTTPTVSTDGLRTYTLTQTDPAGNTTVLTLNWTRDTTGPNIQLDLAVENQITNTATVTFTGICDALYAISVTGSGTGSPTCSAGTFTWTSAAPGVDGSYSYSFSQTNGLGTTTTVVGTWIRETDIPTISAVSTTASDPSKSNFVPTNLTGTSANALVPISHFCFVSNSTVAPIATDECWVSVNSPQVGLTPAQTLNLVGYYNLLGWQPINYIVYAYVKDAAGNISTLTAAGAGTYAVDKYAIGYDPGIAPSIQDVIAANSDTTANPPTIAQGTVPAGTDVYVRWKAWDNLALPAGAIALYYTEDEITFVPISGAETLNNANYGCPGVVLGADEGCFKWTGGSPLNTFYKIQAKVTDTSALDTKLISNPMNTGVIKILAGNTESGLGGSAMAAMFYSEQTTWDADIDSLVMTSSGDLYFADDKRGILTIDRADGKQKIFISATGTSTGDGGVATSATLNQATKIALDYQNRLLIVDRNRIRRVDLNQNPPTIDTIIGGGSDTADTVADPKQLSIYSHALTGWNNRSFPFFALPNGDIYFSSEYALKEWNNPNYRIRVFKAATGQVTSKYLVSGSSSADTGDSYDPTVDLSGCRLFGAAFKFDPMTSQILGITAQTIHGQYMTNCQRPDAGVDERYSRAYFDPVTLAATPLDDWAGYASYHGRHGMDGNVYHIIGRSYVDRINFDGTHTRVLGSGTQGECADGTAALSCNITVSDLFVDPSGKFYFVDGGTIRTVDIDGNVYTLAGQRRNFGDGVNALNARFDSPLWVDQLNNGDLIVGDSYYYKQFSIEGNVNIIAGNGNYASTSTLGVDAKTTGMYDFNWWVADPATGDLYTRGHYERVFKLNRSTGFWEQVVGCGPTEYWLNDGLAGTNKACNGRHLLVIGFDGSKVLTSNMKYNSVDSHYEDFMWKTYDTTDLVTPFRQDHVAGTNDPAKTYVGGYHGMIDGATAADNKMPYYSYPSNPTWDSVGGRWITAQRAYDNVAESRQIWSVTPGGTMNLLITLPRYIHQAYVYVRHSGKEWFYYRYGSLLYYHNLTDNIDMGALNWTIPTMNAQGYKLIYNSSRHSLIFPFNQNGLGGVAEYYLP